MTKNDTVNSATDLELPDWAAWLAQDADGTWWVYEACPNRHDSGWYENELGRCARLHRQVIATDWTQSLRPL